jgi:ABC-2 type transport system ATP-binding protein
VSVRITHPDIRRGHTLALHAAELELPARANVGIIGVNGAGKSTLMHGLAGSLRGRHARPQLHGLVADRIAYTPQQPAFPDWLRAEAIPELFGLELAKLERRFPELLLEELRGKRVATLSVGQRQVLSVAISLATDAPLTLLDEPFASIDFRRRVALLAVLRRRAGRGLALIASQNGADLVETCSWMVVLREGHYVFSGPREELTGGATDGAAALARFEENVIGLLAGGPGLRPG